MAASGKKEALLAQRIAARSTELQRAYDRACATRLRLTLERDRLNDQLAQAEASIVRCRQRAEELGCPEIL